MATVTQVTERPLSGLNYIDALLGALPWNYIGRNTIYFSFAPDPADPNFNAIAVAGTRSAFNAQQQAQAREILAYASALTGITFAEVADPAWADVHFANADLKDGYSSQDSSHVGYTNVAGQAANLQVDVWVYLDNADDAYDNLWPTPGGIGYENLVHEIGHVLGLKHPSEGAQQLPPGNQVGGDNSATTLMSFNSLGGPYTGFRPYDIAALQWLYGGDGIGGRWGVNAAGVVLFGSEAADVLVGRSGNDIFFGGAGNDTIDGAAGTDTVVFVNPRSSYAVARTGNGFSVTSLGGSEGTDTLVNVERIAFSDHTGLALDPQGSGGMAYRLYQAAFNRAPDAGGLGYHIADLDNGLNIWQVADHFLYSPEFQGQYGNLSNENFVRQLYLNVLHREGEAGGVQFHTHNLDIGATVRSQTLVQFSESNENQAAVIGAIQNGMLYTF